MQITTVSWMIRTSCGLESIHEAMERLSDTDHPSPGILVDPWHDTTFYEGEVTDSEQAIEMYTRDSSRNKRLSNSRVY